MNSKKGRLSLVLLVGLLISTPIASGGGREEQTTAGSPEGSTWFWPDRHGEPLPFASEEELREFLRTGRVVSRETTEHGINRPLYLDLEADGVRVRAVFRGVDKTWRNEVGPDGVWVRLYRDSYIYENAAYELSRILELKRVPPTVARRHLGVHGSLQARVENARMEADLLENGIHPPDAQRWARQMMRRRLFDALINNLDRNPGNMMVDEGWEVWYIDHGRSFLIEPDSERIAAIRRTDRDLLQAIENADRARWRGDSTRT